MKARKRHYYPRICLTTVSKYLSNDIKQVLLDLDVHFASNITQPKAKNEHTRYSIYINGIKGINKWLEVIGIANPIQYSRYLIWKRHGFCPANTTYTQRLKIIDGSLNPHTLYKGPIM